MDICTLSRRPYLAGFGVAAVEGTVWVVVFIVPHDGMKAGANYVTAKGRCTVCTGRVKLCQDLVSTMLPRTSSSSLKGRADAGWFGMLTAG